MLRFDPSGTACVLGERPLERIAGRLGEARHLVLDRDVKLLAGLPEQIPIDLQPLDAGFIELPRRLLDDYRAYKENSELGRILDAAEYIREQVDRIVLLGIGGSYLGGRALFDALCHPYHNELPRERRRGRDGGGPVPRIYFEGNNVDNDSVAALLSSLRSACRDPGDPAQRWAIIVISKSGGTLETAAVFRVFLEEAQAYYRDQPEILRNLIVPITGPAGALRDLATEQRFPRVFDIPDGVGGRFSVLTAVGLLPAAVMGIDVVRLLEGAAAMTARFRDAPVAENPVLAYTGIAHRLEAEHGMDLRVLSVWSKALEAVGWWYDQLLSESLGKAEDRGATPITAVGTRDLHSRGQQHQQGRRDKLITNLVVASCREAEVSVPPQGTAPDDLAGKPVSALLQAALTGTCRAYHEAGRPTADLVLPCVDEHALGQLFQMLMLATVAEGRLIDINPYGQPGVEAYKRHMKAAL